MARATVRAFRPFPLLRSPHLQTLLACAQLGREPSSRTCRVRLVDGDQLAVEVSTPAGWTANAPTAVLVHGLCGCHGSPYMVRMTDKLVRRGVRVLRVNLRGCGSGRGLARELYHSGRSDDVLQVLRSFRDEAPDSRTTLVGFSLGGNVALKLAGELGADAAAYLHRVIAVSAPADLEACARRIGRPENRFYERHFIRLLRRAVAERHAAFPDLPAVELPRSLGLFEFDDVYTAPHGGFESALDYYRKSSSAPLVPRIEVPCHVLFADDDPFVRADVFDGVELPANVEVVRTRHGGHLGFLGRPGPGGAYRWMDSQLLAWILEEEAPQRPGFRS